MKILSLNVRGFAVEGKFGWVKELCGSEKPCIAAVQETKCNTVGDYWVESLWGNGNFGYIQKEVVGNSGGLLLVWDTCSFEATDAMGNEFFLAIKGKWKASGQESFIVNVYGPHDDAGKKLLLDSLGNLLVAHDSAWLLCGDFNEVREKSDRLNCEFIQYRANRFNRFIACNRLVDIPIGGRRFTRISDDGIKFSKLDRFLVTQKFLDLWEDLSIVALDRKLSDHCPLVLRDKVIDYGPKPFKVFDAWFDYEDVGKVVMDAWLIPVRGSRKDCIFRDKLKNVKSNLRVWSIRNFGELDSEKNSLKKEAGEWEKKAEVNALTEDERVLWLGCRKKWIEKDKVKAKMLRQKARIRWILDGDENSKFFHSSIKRKYSKCNIRGLNINGVWNDNPSEVKNAMLNHFKTRFQKTMWARPGMSGLIFSSLAQYGRSSINANRPEVVQLIGPDQITAVGLGVHGNPSARPDFGIDSAEAVILEQEFTEGEVLDAIK
ncbi:uncharacterized protein [Rutidosis leptorrhynchoides]|uniref:uncharacterized protein n=1 Tax=Rutidosis leptorrhynchoides TaxID=125765 RepID=UPI003A9A252E